MNFKRGIRVEFDGADVDPIIDLRVAFDVSKSSGETMNKGNITIYNLKPSSRAALIIAKIKSGQDADANPVIKVRLFAGYEGNLKQLISGNILISSNTKIGTDWLTELEIYSGLTESRQAITNIDREGKTPAKIIADKLLEPLGISINYTEKALGILSGKTYTDFTESGMSLIVAKRFLRRFDLAFTIMEDGEGLVYVNREAIDPDSVQSSVNLFDTKNGLIGSPNMTRIGIDFVALLRPEINILQKVYIKSKTVNETLQKEEVLTNECFVRSIRHFGDTHDDNWFTEISSAYTNVPDVSYV